MDVYENQNDLMQASYFREKGFIRRDEIKEQTHAFEKTLGKTYKC